MYPQDWKASIGLHVESPGRQDFRHVNTLLEILAESLIRILNESLDDFRYLENARESNTFHNTDVRATFSTAQGDATLLAPSETPIDPAEFAVSLHRLSAKL